MSTALNDWKEFWIKRIDALKLHKGVDQKKLTENEGSSDNEVWKNKIRKKNNWDDIGSYGISICKNIYEKATRNNNGFPGDNNTLYNELQTLVPDEINYSHTVLDTLHNFEREIQEVSEVFHDKIGIEFDNSNVVDQPNDNKIAAWKHFINEKIPNHITLNNLPNKVDLLGVIYRTELFHQIVDAKALEDLIEWGAIQPDGRRAYINNFHGYDLTYRVDTNKLTEYKNAKTTIANAETHLGLNSGELATITTNPDYNLNGKTLTQLLTPHTCPPCPQTHCPTAHANYDTIKGESAEYQRIHTKLSGKVSDGELDNLLKRVPAPKCSHTDYDTIKQALAKEKEKLTKKEESCELEKQEALAEKEKEIIEKIITDLELSTERERENVLEAVITEIKAKLTPPTDTTEKDNKITELQEQITKLQTPKTLKDLPISKGIKEEVIKISQELGLTTQSCAKLEKATSYQELSSLQKQAFQEKLNSETRERDAAISLNWGLGFLTLCSLLLLAWMIIRESKKGLRKLDGMEKN